MLQAQKFLLKEKDSLGEHEKMLLRNDERAMARGMDPGAWTTVIIGAVILMVILAALFPTFKDALTDYDNVTTDPIAPILVTVVPILLSVSVLLLFVFAFLPSYRGRGK